MAKPVQRQIAYFLLEKETPTSGRYTICENFDSLKAKLQDLVDKGVDIENRVAVKTGEILNVNVRKVVDLG